MSFVFFMVGQIRPTPLGQFCPRGTPAASLELNDRVDERPEVVSVRELALSGRDPRGDLKEALVAQPLRVAPRLTAANTHPPSDRAERRKGVAVGPLELQTDEEEHQLAGSDPKCGVMVQDKVRDRRMAGLKDGVAKAHFDAVIAVRVCDDGWLGWVHAVAGRAMSGAPWLSDSTKFAWSLSTYFLGKRPLGKLPSFVLSLFPNRETGLFPNFPISLFPYFSSSTPFPCGCDSGVQLPARQWMSQVAVAGFEAEKRDTAGRIWAGYQ